MWSKVKVWPLSGKSASAEVGRGKAKTLNSLNLKLCLTVDQCVWILKCAFDKAVLRLSCFNCFALADRMALKVLVGCKRVIDYAVKIRVRPDNLGVRKFLYESLSICTRWWPREWSTAWILLMRLPLKKRWGDLIQIIWDVQTFSCFWMHASGENEGEEAC